jgi:hypothetical protein
MRSYSDTVSLNLVLCLVAKLARQLQRTRTTKYTVDRGGCEVS